MADKLPLVLRPAQVMLKPTGGENEHYYGRLGIDLLKQAHRVTLDFRSMMLTLE